MTNEREKRMTEPAPGMLPDGTLNVVGFQPSTFDAQILFVQQHSDGWWVHDQHGKLDGPYTKSDAFAVALGDKS